jgi:tetratricopeptide (TPR) repeat protein
MTVRDADQALARGETERAHEILAALIDRDPDNAQLLWRDGRALYVMGRADEAFDRYADALVRDDSLQEDAEFFAELDALMRRPDVRSKALDLALQRLDDLAHPFLLSLVNDPEHPPSFVERHRALDRLSSTRRWDEVDLDLHARLDLQQASAATDPCWAYGHGLDVVEDDPTLERLRFVRRYDPPRKEAGCSVAAARRQVLLSALTMVEATSEPDDGRS